MDYKSKIILIAGPTASGKSKIAINLAKKINGEKCKIAGSNWEEPVKDAHIIDFADCFMYYHPMIKEYIASRIK